MCNSQKNTAKEALAEKTATPKLTVEAFGIVKAREIKNLNSDISALVTKVAVTEGQRVKSGELLLTLDVSDFEKELQSKEFELKTVHNDLKRIQEDLAKRQSYLSDNSDPDEAVIGGLSGGIIGTVSGSLSLLVIPFVMRDTGQFMPIHYSPELLPVYFAVVLVIIIVASVSPAFKTSKLNVIEALKYE